LFSFFKAKQSTFEYPLTTDIHSHLLPGIDDGVKTLEESLAVITELMQLGYNKFITTPHVMMHRYPNTSEIILSKLAELKSYLKEKNINVGIDAAAEYYLDDSLVEKLNNKERLLTIGKNYLLFETHFMIEPFMLKDFIFQATSAGYKPILAHPERYSYMTLGKAEDLINRGVLFQVNLPSLLGYYSRPIQQLAYKLIDKGWVHFLGTDCHNANQANLLDDVIKNKYYAKAMNLPLHNHTL
jgi:tyrosine-protein phosphatase YwqE